MRKYCIYITVTITMLGSIVIAGFFGPLVVSVFLEYMAKREKRHHQPDFH